MSRPRVTDRMIGSQALRQQFVAMRRSFLLDGGLATLWRADRGLAVSLLPVMLLLGRGYFLGVDSPTKRLARYSGICERSVACGVRTLTNAGIVGLNEPSSPATISFAVTEQVLKPQQEPGRRTLFPGRIVDAGRWRRLTRCERVVLLALVGSATSRRLYPGHGMEPSIEVMRYHEWLVDVGATQSPTTLMQEFGITVPRVGTTSCSRLARLTGVDRSSASRALQSLSESTRDSSSTARPLVYIDRSAEGTRFHLPNTWWDV